jgi:signal transduction histidine kinase
VTRVTTVGELTAAIAHEVNQPLTGLLTSGHAALRWLAGDPPNVAAAQRAVERMINDGNRAGEVIGRIRAMMKKAPPRLDRLDLNEMLMEVITLIRSELQRNNIVLTTALAHPLSPVIGDRIQLQQVILNLNLNAIEAMSGVHDRRRELIITTQSGAPDGILVSVRDSGHGLDEAALDQLFEPFYTTKPEGMGMGLAISRTIIEAHGGELGASRNRPHGATFWFRLPADTGAAR